MLRFLHSLFLSIAILLLSGYIPLSGQQNTDSNSHCLEQTLTLPDFTNISTAIDGLYITRTPLQTATCEISLPIFENEENNDLVSFKKDLKNCSFTILFLTRVSDSSFPCNKRLLPSYGYHSYTSLLGITGLQVFRI